MSHVSIAVRRDGNFLYLHLHDAVACHPRDAECQPGIGEVVADGGDVAQLLGDPAAQRDHL